MESRLGRKRMKKGKTHLPRGAFAAMTIVALGEMAGGLSDERFARILIDQREAGAKPIMTKEQRRAASSAYF